MAFQGVLLKPCTLSPFGGNFVRGSQDAQRGVLLCYANGFLFIYFFYGRLIIIIIIIMRNFLKWPK